MTRTELYKLIQRLELANELLEEVCADHRDKESREYNGCDKIPCWFCVAVTWVRSGEGKHPLMPSTIKVEE